MECTAGLRRFSEELVQSNGGTNIVQILGEPLLILAFKHPNQLDFCLPEEAGEPTRKVGGGFFEVIDLLQKLVGGSVDLSQGFAEGHV